MRQSCKSACNEWKSSSCYLELEDLAALRKKTEVVNFLFLWKKADDYACESLKGEELNFFYKITD